MGLKNSQDWKNVYVLPFQTNGNHGKLVFSHSYECQRIQTKNPFDKNLSLNFDLGPLKVNTYYVRLSQFCKDYQEDSYNKTNLMGKKIKK